jgi:hypothetical protein
MQHSSSNVSATDKRPSTTRVPLHNSSMSGVSEFACGQQQQPTTKRPLSASYINHCAKIGYLMRENPVMFWRVLNPSNM